MASQIPACERRNVARGNLLTDNLLAVASDHPRPRNAGASQLCALGICRNPQMELTCSKSWAKVHSLLWIVGVPFGVVHPRLDGDMVGSKGGGDWYKNNARARRHMTYTRH